MRHPEADVRPNYMLIFDLHLDLSMNALDWNRELRLEVRELRRRERGNPKKGMARGTTTFPEMRRGHVGLASATLIARMQFPGNPLPGLNSQEVCYAVTQGQLAYYRAMAAAGECRLIRTVEELETMVAMWSSSSATQASSHLPLGFVISMEGADAIVSPEQVAEWWESGLRIVSLVHYGRSTYAGGTGTTVGLSERARPLLIAMRAAGMILDTTHLSDESFREVLELWDGPIFASHQMCRALCPGERQFTDEQIRRLIERDGLIAAALDAWMFTPGWIRGQTQPEGTCTLSMFVDHIDHVCQLAGNARHAAIGTDLDGGYGTEQTPHDLDTIADLQKLPDLLRARGYSDEDIRGICHENSVRFLRAAWTQA